MSYRVTQPWLLTSLPWTTILTDVSAASLRYWELAATNIYEFWACSVQGEPLCSRMVLLASRCCLGAPEMPQRGKGIRTSLTEKVAEIHVQVAVLQIGSCLSREKPRLRHHSSPASAVASPPGHRISWSKSFACTAHNVEASFPV